MEPEYQYEIKESNPFSFFNLHYFQYQNLIVAISRFHCQERILITTFDIETKIFTPLEEYRQVRYEELKDKTYMWEWFDHIIIIDMVNKEYSRSCQFPFMISEIDGNYITSCRDKKYFYIFHSKTCNYETGVFIFDIENNTFNDNDFTINNKFVDGNEDNGAGAADEIYQSERTNIFAALHHKDISTCCIYNGDIIINIEDKTYQYDIELNELLLILDNEEISDMRVYDNKIFIKSNYHNFHFYDCETSLLDKDIIVNDKGEICYHIGFYNNKLILMTGHHGRKTIKIYHIS